MTTKLISKRFSEKIALLLLVIIQSFPSSGQSLRYNFKKLGIENGLSQSVINDIAQDPYGFMWVATNDGLNKYTGSAFEIIRRDFEFGRGLTESNIQSLCVTKDSMLWIGTAATGINVLSLNTGAFRFINTSNSSITSNNIRCLHEDKDGIIWIGTSTGLHAYNPGNGKIVKYYKTNSPGMSKSNLINKIVEDTLRHCFWIYIEFDGIYRLDPKERNSYSKVPFEHDPDLNTINDGAFGYNGTIWAATGNGIYCFDDRTSQFREFTIFPEFNKTKQITSILVQDTEIWMSIYDIGLCRMNVLTKEVTYKRAKQSEDQLINPVSVKCMRAGKSGLIWFGTNGNGIEYIDPRSNFNTLDPRVTSAFRISSSSIRAISEDSQDKDILWIGGYGGLDQYSKSKGLLATFNTENATVAGMHHDAVYSIFQLSHDTLLMGVEGGGLYVFSKKTKRFREYYSDVKKPGTVNGNLIYCFFKDDRGTLWAGTDNGFCSINTHDFKAKKYFFDSLKISRIDAFSITQFKNFLLISTNKGIITFNLNTNKGSFTGIRDFNHENDAFYHLLVDREYLWIATDGWGLLKCAITSDENKVSLTLLKEINQKSGLSNDVVYAIIKSSPYDLWVSTNYGLNNILFLNNTIRRYTNQEGLQSNEFNKCAYYKSRDGMLYFGGIKGLSYFDPLKIKLNRMVPQVSFTGIDIYKQNEHPIYNLNYSKQVSINYEQNVITIHFCATDFHAPDKNQYAYILNGFNDRYTYIGNNQSVTFTNLDPGKYTLNVIACNNDGYWNMEGRTLDIAVIPPFWLTWWFKTGCVLLVALLITLAVRLRIRSIRKRAEKLEEDVISRTSELIDKNKELDTARMIAEKTTKTKSDFLAMMSHEIRTPMNGVIGMVSLLQGTPLNQEQKRYVQTIKYSYDILLQVINDILDFSKLDSDKIELATKQISFHHLLENIVDLFYNNAISKNLVIGLVIDKEVPRIIMGDEVRLGQIISNLINNAIKFTSKGHVLIRVKLRESNEDDNEIGISVIDTGIGIEKNKQSHIFEEFTQADVSITRDYGGTGLGLSIVKKLATRMGGTIMLNSSPGKGSTFTLVFRAKSVEPEHDRKTTLPDHYNVVLHDIPYPTDIVLENYCNQFGLKVNQTHDDHTLHILCASDTKLKSMQSINHIKQQYGSDVKFLVLVKPMQIAQILEMRDVMVLAEPVKKMLLYYTLNKLIHGETAESLESNNIPEQSASNGEKNLDFRILVAEDNEINKLIISKMIIRAGYQADFAANGREVLDTLGKRHYDLILMDIQMPDMDGITAARLIRERYKSKVMPKIIAVTASVIDEQVKNYFEAGMVDVLAKPMSFEELNEKLDHWSLLVAEEKVNA